MNLNETKIPGIKIIDNNKGLKIVLTNSENLKDINSDKVITSKIKVKA